MPLFGGLFGTDQINNKLDRLITTLSIMEKRFMASIEELTAAFDRVQTEVGETSTEVKNLRDEIVDLKTKIGNNAELEAAIEAAVTKANAIADSLDGLQTHTPAPVE